jgi:hypothetical protein
MLLGSPASHVPHNVESAKCFCVAGDASLLVRAPKFVLALRAAFMRSSQVRHDLVRSVRV